MAKEVIETRVRCPYCGKLYEQKDIEDHIRNEHREILD